VGKERIWALAAEPLEALAEVALDDVVYLAPVAQDFEALRRRVAAAQGDRGTPVLYQLLPGQVPPSELVGTAVYDLLPALLDARRGDAGALDSLASLPVGSTAIWPLIAGISDDPARWREGCEALASAGVAVCQPLVLHLKPRQRRRLAEQLDEDAFSALFHRSAPSERDFAVSAAQAGLCPFLPRPLPRPPFQHPQNRRMAAELALIGELWHRLGHTGSRGAAFYRASRWLDATTYDVAALAREGNLEVIEPLDAASRQAVRECLEESKSRIRRELEAEYLQTPSHRDTIGAGGSE
jgi:hypothetical protein